MTSQQGPTARVIDISVSGSVVTVELHCSDAYAAQVAHEDIVQQLASEARVTLNAAGISPITTSDLTVRQRAIALLEEIESEGFACEAGPLRHFIAWEQLRALVEKGLRA